MSPSSHPRRAPRSRRALAASVAVLAAACLATVTVAAGPAGASASRITDTYTVAKNGVITGHRYQTPGRKKISIVGHKGELFQLARSKHGAGASRFLADAAVLDSKGDPKPLEKDFDLAGGAQVGQTFYAALKPGNYYAVDINAAKPSVKHIVVSGRSTSIHRPTNVIIQAIHDTTWDASPKSIPGKGVIQFQNHADQPHFIDLARLKPGKTDKDVAKALAGKESQSAVFYSGASDSFGTGVLSPRRTMYTTYKLKAGNWELLCFWPDAKTGMPHAYMGMHRSIVVK